MDVLEAEGGMRKIEGFVQRFPDDGRSVSERTVAYVGYDDHHLYVVFLCFDREREKIGARVVGRDLIPGDDDGASVHIDTFRDLKHAYGFLLNPRGVQMDGLYTEGSGWDLSWDTTWDSDAMITAQGYVVLFKIPFKSLRFPDGERQEWGIFLYRAIGRRNEESFWPECTTRIATRFPQAALIELERAGSSGRNLQVIPYVSSRSFKALELPAVGRPTIIRKLADTGLGLDFKAIVRDSLVFDAAINPDFSQVESDQPQITVNRPFEVYFPEKRPFFLENASFFNTPINLLFTRRIGNPTYGGRATGRIGPYAIGALVIDDRPFDSALNGDPRAWNMVGRVMRDVGDQSYVGGFVSARRGSVMENNVGSLDARVRLGQNWFALGQSAFTRTVASGSHTRSGAAWLASIVGAGSRFDYKLDVSHKGPDFGVLNGFVPRVNTRSIDQMYAFRWRPVSRLLQAWGPEVVANRTWDANGRPLDWFATGTMKFRWSRRTTLDMYYTSGMQTLRPEEAPTVRTDLESSSDRVGVNFGTAMLAWATAQTTLSVGDSRNLTPAGALQPQPGQLVNATATTSVRVSPSLTLDYSYLFDRLRDPATKHSFYANHIHRLRIGKFFTRALSLRSIVQYTDLAVDPATTSLQVARKLNYDLLLAYVRSPGSALYVGVNYNLANINSDLAAISGMIPVSTRLHNDNWQVFTKISYLIRP